MNKKKLAAVVVGCLVAIGAVVVVVMLRPTSVPKATLVTYNCTGGTASVLTVQAEVTDASGAWVIRRGFQYSREDSGDLPEIISLTNGSFERGDPPRGWGVYEVTSARVSDLVKAGDCSVQITSEEGKRGKIFQRNPRPVEEAGGRTFTFGAWVYATEGDRVSVAIRDVVAGEHKMTTSVRHPGDGTWRWLTVTRTLRSNLDYWEVEIDIESGSQLSAYADGAILAEGSELLVAFEDGRFGKGTYSLDITDLAPGTRYRVRAFAETEGGIGYGNVVSCRTRGQA